MEKKLDSDLLINDYGYIRIKLNEMMVEKGITVYYLAKMAQVGYAVAKRWCDSSEMCKLDTDVLARFCHVLRCDLSDIIEFVPQRGK